MRIQVRARTRAKVLKVEEMVQPSLPLFGILGDPVYRVSVPEPPVDGRANEAIARALAAYFSVAKSTIVLVSGHTSKKKVFEIPTY
jgi:uncharacterized protein YggU (UPF0235/DUF167 family)